MRVRGRTDPGQFSQTGWANVRSWHAYPIVRETSKSIALLVSPSDPEALSGTQPLDNSMLVGFALRPGEDRDQFTHIAQGSQI